MNTDRLTRRSLLGGAAAAGATLLALPARAEAQTSPTPVHQQSGRSASGVHQADVVVIGGGFAGVAAAKNIATAGRSVLLLEGRGRIGGRVLNTQLSDGQPIEIGGQWVGPTQDRVIAWSDEVGVARYATHDEGSYVDWYQGRRSTYDNRIPLSDPVATAEAGVLIERLNLMAAQVDPAAPWAAAQAHAWDGQTMRSWMDDNLVSEGGKSLASLVIEAVWACDPDDVSFLHVLFYIASAFGDLNLLINTTGGAQEQRFVEGSQEVVLRQAAMLGDAVILGARARHIAQGADRVTVTADGLTVTAQRLIVAVPPHLAGAIETTPGVGALRSQLTQRVPMGSVIKAMAVYDTPFWRDEGLAGQATSDEGPVKITFDNTPASGSPGVLLGFFEADDARTWSGRTQVDRRDAFLDATARYFGDRIHEATHYLDMDWQVQSLSGGGYVGFTPPGVLTRYGPALREPVGRIHWAGTETAVHWNGYMDGAIRSGERVAAEVLEALDVPAGPLPPAEETEPKPVPVLPATGGGAVAGGTAALVLREAVRRRGTRWSGPRP